MLESQPVEYWKLDDGLGGTYERIAYGAVIERLAEQYDAKKLLELNATYIAGVPGFNSAMFTQDGYEVTITIHPRDYEDAVHAWKLAGLYDHVRIIKWKDSFRTPFDEGEFDLVWNHLAFEHYKDPIPLVREMVRVSRKLVINFTLSPFNMGFLLHWLAHKINRKKWDHGHFRNCLISAMEKVHRSLGLQPIEWGGCDDPPWMDTVDAQIAGSMRYVGNTVGKKRWVWGATNPKARDHFLIKNLWKMEYLMPDWFRKITAHHLYVVGLKKI
ncbi:MAG: methyltransferase domain-containing protein [archaeon]|nr:methyltransferase domain-containing protein [archaeon]MCP8314415.1 methyltransferase domain-containing protein [archaeon]MCP8319379.1 methyltransferase domain-containing protein [archaeon]